MRIYKVFLKSYNDKHCSLWVFQVLRNRIIELPIFWPPTSISLNFFLNIWAQIKLYFFVFMYVSNRMSDRK